MLSRLWESHNLTSLCGNMLKPKYLKSQMKMRGNRDEREQRLQMKQQMLPDNKIYIIHM